LIPFLDLAADFAEVEDDARRRIDGVLARQQFVLGPETLALEEALRLRLGAQATVAVSSGTEALALSLLALGIGAGDAVVVPAFTFFATAGAVVRAGAEPVFCDIDASTFLAGATQMRAAIDREFTRRDGALRRRGSGAKLAALMPVHLYGRACDMPAIEALAGEVGAKIVEDAAQALGARIGTRAVGAFGDTGCFSFYPTKNLGGPGDGGLVACRQADLAARLVRLRSHGGDHGSYEHHEAGINARMSELAAAVLNAKLVRFDDWTARRRTIADFYNRHLADAVAEGLVELPAPCDLTEHVWHQYAVRIAGESRRDHVRARLEAAGIATRVFYPVPLHRQPCFSHLADAGDFREADAASREVLCLPIYPSMSDTDADEVTSALVEAARSAQSAA
jgi:dTDP-4-amino-4,6-dideoxygalactose transaminase